MSIQIKTIKQLSTYVNGVMHRTEHAPNVVAVIPQLLLEVIKLDPDEIRVREYKGVPANMMWISKNEKRYSFLYNHHNQTIELRKDSFKGRLIAVFSNNTSTQDIINAFNIF